MGKSIVMRPNTRLLIRLTFDDGSMRSWGYDYPHYPTTEYLQTNLKEDFAEIPDNTEIRLFYFKHDGVITAETGEELAEKTIDWLQSTGDYT